MSFPMQTGVFGESSGRVDAGGVSVEGGGDGDPVRSITWPVDPDEGLWEEDGAENEEFLESEGWG